MLTAESYIGGTLIAIDGDFPDEKVVRQLWEHYSPVVAADGAALRLLHAGIRPDVVVGDMDTLGNRAQELQAASIPLVVLPDQETGDFEKALLWCIGQQAETATIIGASGGMVDHTLNNFSVLAKYASKLRLSLHTSTAIGYILNSGDAITLNSGPGSRVSLIPLHTATVATIGLAWNLQNEPLEFGKREGASNKNVLEQFSVEISSGTLLLFHYKQ